MTIIGLCLVALSFFKKEFYCSNHTLVFAGLSVFSLIVTSWASNPTLHHFGSPLLGEGSVLFFGLSTLSLALDNISKKNPIYYSAIAAGITAGTLVFLHHPQHGLNINANWLPYAFGAFLAPISLCIYAIRLKIKSSILQRILLFLSCGLLFLSHNKTAWIAVFLCLGIWPIIKNRHAIQKYLCLSIPFISAMSLFVLGRWLPSLESRKLALQSYLVAWQDRPLKLATGNGWGYYFENLQKQILDLPVSFFDNNSWKPSWDGIDRLDFHCMHLGTEALFSLGIIGLILYLCLLAIPFSEKASKKNRLHLFLYTILFGCLTSTWFTLICVWPFFILGFSVFNQPRIKTTQISALITWLFFSAILSGHAAITYWQTAVLYPSNQQSIFYKFTHSKKFPTSVDLKRPYNYKGMHLGHFVLAILKKVNSSNLPLITMKELDLAFRIYEANNSPLILDVALMHGIQYFERSALEKQHLWDSAAAAIEQKAPKRSDLLVSYVQALIESNQLDKAKDFIKRMYAKNSHDPFALWLDGLYLIHNKNIEQGKALMRQSLRQHIDKWIYIPESLKTKIKEELSPSL